MSARRFRPLAASVERVSRRWFRGVLHPRAVWKRGCRLKQRPVGIACAEYDATCNTIRVHPVFSAPAVPLWVLDWVIYHEMLHLVYGQCHSTEFRVAEAAHPKTRAADEWLSTHLFELALERGKK